MQGPLNISRTPQGRPVIFQAGASEDGKKLAARHAEVTVVTAYENVLDGAGADDVRARLTAGTIDAVTFTSSSTVKNFVTALGDTPLPPGVAVACIGPSTARTAEDLLGRAPDVTAQEPSVAGLMDALAGFWTTR